MKKVILFFLAVLMVVTAFPMSAFANNPYGMKSSEDMYAYKEILDMYHTSISCNWSNCDGEGWNDVGDPDNVCYIFYQYEADRSLNEVGYMLLDINNDGQSELFVTMANISQNGSFYDMYTIVDGVIIHVIAAGERDRYNLAEDYSINNIGSSSAFTTSFDNYRLDKGSGALRINKAVLYDKWRDPDNPWFYTNMDYYDSNTNESVDSAWIPISEEEYYAIADSFPDNLSFELTTFDEYAPSEDKDTNENNIGKSNCTYLKGLITDYSPDILLDSIKYELKDSFKISFASFSDSLIQRIGAYSACYADINNNNQDELIAVCISKNDNDDTYTLALICFYTGYDNYIYFSKLDTQRYLTNSYASYSCDVYIENGYIYISNSFASGIEGSGSNWRNFTAIYNFENNNWNCLEDYFYGVNYGTEIFVDNINNISLNTTIYDPSILEQINTQLQQKEDKLKNIYKITTSDETKMFDSSCLRRSNDFSWEVECIVEENIIFNKNKYIADIWLNRHHSVENTIENGYINSLLSINGHFSSDLSDDLYKDKGFINAIAGWKSMEVFFSPMESTAELVYLDQNKIYQTLIFDLIKQSLSNEAYKELVSSNWIQISSSLNSAFGTGSSILNELHIDNYEQFKKLALDDDIELDQKYFKILYDNFKSADKVFKNIDNFCFIAKGIIEGAATITDFINQISMYYIAMQLSLDQSAVLYEMATHTTSVPLKDALMTIADIAKNDDFSAGLLKAIGEATDKTGLYLTSFVADEAMRLVPVYGTLKTVYDVASSAVDILLNTNGIIDAYYLILCTSELCNASKMSISSLAEKYINNATEANAGAFIESVKIYIKLIGVDLESGCSFIKATSEDGLYNLSKKVDKKILSLFGFSTTNTYDEVCQSKDNIMQSVEFMYDWIETSWVINENYLQTDYPQVYPIYAQEEILKDIYTPVVTNIRLNKDGKTELQFGFVQWVDGIEVTENVAGTKRIYTNAPTDSIVCYDESKKDIFPKNYTASSYFKTVEGNVYSNPSKTHSVNLPLMTPMIVLPTFRDIMTTNHGKFNEGITIAVSDMTNTYYDNIKYHIFRKTDNSDYEEIAVVDRNSLFNGKTTLYTDKNVITGESYSYKVQSEIVFNNGFSAISEMSDSISFADSVFDSRLSNISLNDLRIQQNTPSQISLFSYRETTFSNSNKGVKISWENIEKATGYEIYRAATYSEVFKLIGNVKDAENFVDTTVTEGVSYNYCIVAYTEENGERIYSDYSNVERIDYQMLRINEDEKEIYVGEEFQFTAYSSAENDAFVWSVSDESVATIDASGKLTATKAGTVTVTVTNLLGIECSTDIVVVEKTLVTGDANGDGKITAADARIALRVSARVDKLEDYNLTVAAIDVTADGKITAADARKILRIAAKIE